MKSSSLLNGAGWSTATLHPLCASTAQSTCSRASSSPWRQSSSSGSTGRKNLFICRGLIPAQLPIISLCSNCLTCTACVLRVWNTIGTSTLFAASTARKKCSTRWAKLRTVFLIRTWFRIRPQSSSTSHRGSRWECCQQRGNQAFVVMLLLMLLICTPNCSQTGIKYTDLL